MFFSIILLRLEVKENIEPKISKIKIEKI